MEKFFVAAGGVLLVTLFVIIGVVAYRHHMRCLDAGGYWSQENCRDVHSEWCATHDLGNGLHFEQCYPTVHTECDHVCRGAKAEQ